MSNISSSDEEEQFSFVKNTKKEEEDPSSDEMVAADDEDDEIDTGDFVAQQRSSTPSTIMVGPEQQADEFTILTGNLSEVTGDFDLLQIGHHENGINVDLDRNQPLDLEEHLSAFRRRMAASGIQGNIAVPRSNIQAQKPLSQNAQQTSTSFNNGPMVKECMASIELSVFRGIHHSSLNVDEEQLYKDKHLILWKIGGGHLPPLLCQKVEEIVRSDQMLCGLAMPNFGELDKRAWAKFFPAGQNQFGGQQFRVDYGGEQMKNETEYTVHLFLGLSSTRQCQQRSQNRRQNVPTDQESLTEESDANLDNDGCFPINILDLHGKIHRLYRLNSKTKISELKVKIFEKIGIPMEQQRLIFFGMPIDKELNKDLGFFNIGKNSTIHLVMRLIAGHFKE